MIYHSYVFKGTDDATDFEGNYIGDAVSVDKVIHGSDTINYIKKQDYTDFKANIDGTTITWSDVKYIDYPKFYELWLEVS